MAKTRKAAVQTWRITVVAMFSKSLEESLEEPWTHHFRHNESESSSSHIFLPPEPLSSLDFGRYLMENEGLSLDRALSEAPRSSLLR